MPLCTVEIPRFHYDRLLAEDRKITIANVCGVALNNTIDKLNIPNLGDREYRVVVNNSGTNPGISISFTCGSVEYPSHTPGVIFDPSKEQMRTAALAILASTRESDLRIHQVRMEAWRDTTFRMRPWDESEPLPPKPTGKTVVDVGQPVGTIVLSPSKTRGISVTREGEPPREDDPYQKVTQEVLELVVEGLGLPEGIAGETRLVYSPLAETDVSVEVDFPDAKRGALSAGERLYLARTIEQHLDSSELTREGSTTVWIRQGHPDTVVVS